MSFTIPLLLNTLPDQQLQDITIAWYGNREEIYNSTQERAVFPRACPVCTAAIRHFYQQFPVIQSSRARKALLTKLLSQNSNCGCGCLNEARLEIAAEPVDSFATRYEDYISYIKAYSPRRYAD